MDRQTILQLQGEYRILLMQAGLSSEKAGKLAGIIIEKLMRELEDE